MYKKVINDDGELESLNDKRASCILLRNGLATLIENFRYKVLSLQDLHLLEEILDFSLGIHNIMYKVIEDYTKTKLLKSTLSETYYPLIRQAHQMSIHSVLCSMACMLSDLKQKRYFTTCNKVFVLNHFLQTLNPSILFLQEYLKAHPHFHEPMPVPPKRNNQGRRWTPRY